LPWKRSDIPVTWPGIGAVLLPELPEDGVLAAVAFGLADAAPPAGDVGLVGASVHAAVTAHTKPSQARAILIDIIQTAKAGHTTPGPPAGRAVL
jgi:hypothetical protein